MSRYTRIIWDGRERNIPTDEYELARLHVEEAAGDQASEEAPKLPSEQLLSAIQRIGDDLQCSRAEAIFLAVAANNNKRYPDGN